MKSLMWRLCMMAALMVFVVLDGSTPAFAQERGGPADRIERLERRVNEMAERQEQMMRQFEMQMGHREMMRQPSPETLRPPLPPAGAPTAAKLAKGVGDTLGLLFLIGVISNILLAIWIFTDLRKRGEGSGIFVAVALVAGIPAAIIYALTRLGDKKA